MSGECDDCGEHTIDCYCKDRWISVEDRLPIEPCENHYYNVQSEDVLLYDGTTFLIGYYEYVNLFGEWCVYNVEHFDPITHWKPLESTKK